MHCKLFKTFVRILKLGKRLLVNYSQSWEFFSFLISCYTVLCNCVIEVKVVSFDIKFYSRIKLSSMHFQDSEDMTRFHHFSFMTSLVHHYAQCLNYRHSCMKTCIHSIQHQNCEALKNTVLSFTCLQNWPSKQACNQVLRFWGKHILRGERFLFLLHV